MWDQVLTDQPINIASSQFTSWFTNKGSRAITATQALEYSSNTYMVQIAIKLLGQQYVPVLCRLIIWKGDDDAS